MISIEIESSRINVPAGDEPQLLYLLLDFASEDSLAKSGSPVNLCLVIDRSTSMDGSRLESVKQATRSIFEGLRSEDIFSLVTFSDRAETIWSPGDKRDRGALVTAIERIEASGGTEIFQGLQLGVEHIRRSTLKRFTNQLFILTDGHTYGDDEACLTLARNAAGDGIIFSAYGIGPEWNDRFLDKLVGFSGGDTVYIESPTKIPRDLNQRIQKIGLIYARNLMLSNSFPSGARLTSVFRVAPVAQPLSLNGKDLRLGSVQADGPLSLMLEFTISPSDTVSTITLPLIIHADIPSEGVSNYKIQKNFTLNVTVEKGEFVPSERLLSAVQAYNFYQMNEKAWKEVESGNFDSAQTRLRELSTRLLEVGQNGLANQILGESELLKKHTTVSLAGRKRLKFGTRALLTKTVRLPR
jgi:Ca-activated chloride channel family protein